MVHRHQQHVIVLRQPQQRPRISGPCARSNGARRLHRRQTAKLRRPVSGSAQICSTSAKPTAAAAIRCTGSPSCIANVVRKRLVPRHDPSSARCQRRLGRACPRSRSPPGDVVGRARSLQLFQEPQPLLRKRQRQATLPRNRHDRRRRHCQPPAASAASTAPPAPPLSALEQCPQRQLDAEAPAAPATKPRSASSEWPPSSKKLSCTPTRSSPSTSAQIPPAPPPSASAAPRSPPRVASPSGAGSALRSSLPFGVSGSASSTHERAPAPCTPAAASATLPAAPATATAHRPVAAPRTPPAACSPGSSSRASTTASRTPGCSASAASISPELDAEAADLHLIVATAQDTRSRRPAATAPGRPSGTAARPAAAERVGDERSAVSSAGSDSRAPRPAPPMYSSPATPTGTGLSAPSST